MTAHKRIDQLYRTAQRLPVDNRSRIVLMSDCHRSVGNGADNFAKNQNLYYVAMQHYNREKYTYLELGDGDELWENKHFADIAQEYGHIFELLSELYQDHRMHMLWGNHDMVKRGRSWGTRNLYAMLDEHTGRVRPLFPGIRPQEALVLQHKESGESILLLHGHQADFFNYNLWWLSKYLVRYLWQPLQLIGIRDPFSAGKNYNRRLSVEGKLTAWSKKSGHMLVAGHTHRQVFPAAGEPLYFNDGCSVHPRHITAIEIAGGEISLVKWTISTGRGGVLFVDRKVMEGPVPLMEYFMEQNINSEEVSSTKA